MTNVHITKVADVDDLFCHYSGQHDIQGSYLALDLEDGELSASYNAEIGNGVPASVFHQRTLRFTIPALTATTANTLMEQVAPIAQEILDDAEIEWDGNNNVGRLGDSAQAAYDKVAQMCEPTCFSRADLVTEYDAGDWFSDEGHAVVITRLGITSGTTNEEITKLAKSEVEDAKTCGEGHTILTGAEEYLLELRDDLRDDN